MPNHRMHRTAASVPLAVPSGRWPSVASDAERWATLHSLPGSASELHRGDHLSCICSRRGQMRYAGVLFDLFGTLIPPFRRREHMEVLRACAQVLGLSFDACYRCWGETYLQRTRGEFVSIADNFR